MKKTARDLRAFKGVSIRLATHEERRLDALARRLKVPRARVARLAFDAGLASLERGAPDA